MTGGRSTVPAPGHTGTFTIWALHAKVGRWTPIRTGMAGHDAVTELTQRQDRLRRGDVPCRMIVLEDGEVPQ